MAETFPRMTVDREADAAYIELGSADSSWTVQLGHGIVVDLGADGVPVGYEILSLHGAVASEPHDK